MKQILVAIDYSQHSSAVFKYSMKLAQHFEASVDFVSVVHKLKLSESNLIDKAKTKSDYLLSEEERLKTYIQNHYGKQYHSLQINSFVRVGSTSKEVAELAKEVGSDLLLIGNHYVRMNSFFDASSDSLMSFCPCPVMTIPEGAQYTAIKRIIYVSTFLLEDCAAIFELQEWLKIYKGQLICVNVSKDEYALQNAERKMEILKRLFPQESISFECLVADQEEEVENFTNLNEGDVLCSMHRNQDKLQWFLMPRKSRKNADSFMKPTIVFHQHMLSSKLGNEK